jgi:clan AA aspartic protease (TIGR02281 family)
MVTVTWKIFSACAVIVLTCLSFHESKADVFEEMRCIQRVGKSGIDACSQAISSDPDNANLFLFRADKYMDLKDWNRAIGDFTTYIEMSPDQASGVYGRRGEAWYKVGELDKAIADFQASLARLKTNTSRISELKGLLARAENEKKKIDETKSANPFGSRVKMVQEGGVYTIPVTLNDALTLNFVLDSGASEVSIPSDVVSTLVRTGAIKDADFTGSAKYRLADGSTVVSRTFIIRSLKVGDKRLNNVSASVASGNSPLLLGQSFLKQFKSWSQDNTSHELVLE